MMLQVMFFLFPENYVWIFPAFLSIASLLIHRWATVQVGKIEKNGKIEHVWKWLFLPLQTIVISVLNSLTITSVLISTQMDRRIIGCPCYIAGELCANPCEPWGHPTWARVGLLILLTWTVLFGLFLGTVISLMGRSRSRKVQTVFQAMTWIDISIMLVSTVVIIIQAKAANRI
jgi:hypothetical protein